MRKNLFRLFALILTLALAGGTLSSCSDDNYYYYEGADFETIILDVAKNHWTWNEFDGRYEYYFNDIRQITSDVINRGAVTGGVYVGETDANGNRIQVVKALPYVQTYVEVITNPGGGQEEFIYTETISFDYTQGSIGFYIQASDLIQAPEYLADYRFKINVFYKYD